MDLEGLERTVSHRQVPSLSLSLSLVMLFGSRISNLEISNFREYYSRWGRNASPLSNCVETRKPRSFDPVSAPFSETRHTALHLEEVIHDEREVLERLLYSWKSYAKLKGSGKPCLGNATVLWWKVAVSKVEKRPRHSRHHSLERETIQRECTFPLCHSKTHRLWKLWEEEENKSTTFRQRLAKKKERGFRTKRTFANSRCFPHSSGQERESERDMRFFFEPQHILRFQVSFSNCRSELPSRRARARAGKTKQRKRALCFVLFLNRIEESTRGLGAVEVRFEEGLARGKPVYRKEPYLRLRTRIYGTFPAPDLESSILQKAQRAQVTSLFQKHKSEEEEKGTLSMIPKTRVVDTLCPKPKKESSTNSPTLHRTTRSPLSPRRGLREREREREREKPLFRVAHTPTPPPFRKEEEKKVPEDSKENQPREREESLGPKLRLRVCVCLVPFVRNQRSKSIHLSE